MKSKLTAVHTVHSVEDYKNFLSGSNAPPPLSVEVISFRSALEKMLMDDTSDLTQYLQRLSEEDKVLLIMGLLKNDHDLLNKVLSPMFLSEPDTLSKLQDIVKHGELDGDGQWLNNTCLALIKRLLENDEGEQLPKAYCQQIMTLAMKKIPDTLIDLPSKLALFVAIIPGSENLRLAYKEIPNPLKENKFPGDIKPGEFLFAIHAPDLDKSEYLFLVLALLQKHALKNEHIKLQLSLCRQLYMETHYEEAIKLITDLCKEYQNEIGGEECAAIFDVQTKLLEISIDKNYSRRFFENRVALLYRGQGIGQDVIEGINRIAIEFFGHKTQPASSPEEAQALILNLADLETEEITEKELQLKQNSTEWENRGYFRRRGFISEYQRALGEKSEIVMTRNMGVMRSSQPNFPDELSEHSVENKGPDINRTSENSYAFRRARSAYIASISGHGFTAAALLLVYLERNPSCTTNNQDINHFLKLYASVYVSHSFHSLLEVMDVFTQPHIKKMFADYGVTIDTQWPDFILEQAFKDTQEYTKKLCKQRIVREQLNSRLSVTVEEGNLSEMESLLEQYHEPNTISPQGLTPLILALKRGEQAIVKKLIEAGADPTQSMFIAIKEQDGELVKALLQYPIDISSSFEGYNLLEYSHQYGNEEIIEEMYLFLQFREDICKKRIARIKEDPSNTGRQQAIESLKKFEVDISEEIEPLILFEKRLKEFLFLDSIPLPLSKEQAEQEIEGRPLLFVAIDNARDDLVEAALEAGADPDVRLENGYTPLCIAVENNSCELMKRLISAGAGVGQDSEYCNSPLAIAVINGHKKAAKILIDAGAEPNGVTIEGINLITLAIQNRDVAMVNLLLKKGASLSQQDKNIMLLNALYDNNEDDLQFLLSIGASPDSQDSGEPALCIAASQGFAGAAEALLKYGANPDAYRYYDEERQNLNALQLAIKKGYPAIVVTLLEHGANLAYRDVKELTMVQLAREHHHPLIAQIIEEFQAQKISMLHEQINNINEEPANPNRQVALIALKEFADEIAQKSELWEFLQLRIQLFTELDDQYKRFLKLLTENKIQTSKIEEVKNYFEQEFTNFKENKNILSAPQRAEKTINQAIFQANLRLFEQKEKKPDSSPSDPGIKNDPSKI
ncbi:ankyrin repeat domain-containing protein [Legionella maioricensis]|uniref:Ankyrin repeat domain-containing protein n=1 Tax=Legionella maioricensis TaxID=2896528 RepID=A0A9X2ICC0_9GAMM|nr:ankyrin repeat domain-containing protein [Legionella maioricensis]MCL9683603.1 ankyrin repeat domain-containing protein [Legionella maioricensis]MCL9687625.1 ankyrin repeat domain-containing protein [Legionella maioricensis]